jgi:hypothetical protein
MKHIVIFIFALIVGTVSVSSQQHDLSSMTNDQFLLHLKELRTTTVSDQLAPQDKPLKRCALDITFEIISRRASMSPGQRVQLDKIMTPPTTQKSIMSPSGLFKIFYDTTGTHTPALITPSQQRIDNTYNEYAARTAEFFDEVYEVEVTQLGYDPPPSPPYEVYIRNNPVGSYGATFTSGLEIPGQVPRYHSYIEMDNDFGSFYSSGLEGVQVTAAHEFHHMIQLGAYGYWGSNNRYIYEMTSTYFEDAVYPDVNDYYQYLDTHFENPHATFYSIDGGLIGYQKSIFLEMLVKKYGIDVVLHAWQHMSSVDPVNAVDRALASEQTSYAQELCRFALWNHYTGYRAEQQPSSERYTEAALYPIVKLSGIAQLIGGEAMFSGSLQPSGSQYYKAYFSSDTIIFIVANNLAADMVFDSSRYLPRAYNITVLDNSPGEPYIPLENGWSYKFETSDIGALCSTAIVNESIQDRGIKHAFPNPFLVGNDDVIHLPLPGDADPPSVSLRIISVSGNLVYHGENTAVHRDQQLGKFISWDGITSTGEVTASGVYFYSIDYEWESVVVHVVNGEEVSRETTKHHETKTGKFAVVRR